MKKEREKENYEFLSQHSVKNYFHYMNMYIGIRCICIFTVRRLG